MNIPELNTLSQALKRLGDLRSEIWDALSKPASDRTEINLAITPAGMTMTLSELDLLLGSVSDFASALSSSKPLIFLPRSQIAAFASNIEQINNIFNTISGILKQGGLRTVSDISSLNVVTNGGNSYQLAQYFANIANVLDQALTPWIIIRSAVRSPKFSDFNAALQTFNDRRTALDAALNEAREVGAQAQQIRKKAEEDGQTTAEQRSEVERLRGLIAQDRQTISEYAAEGSQRIETVRTVAQQAETLQATVSAYEQTFLQFQAELEGRNKLFSKLSAELNDLSNDLKAKQTEIARLIVGAEGMLKGATNAGLAGTFSARQRATGWEAFGARWSFYLSIVVLLIVSIPLAAYVLPRELLLALVPKGLPLNPADVLGKPAGDHSPGEIIGQVLARALLLIPGIWLVRFSASRHERLFKLREHYAYKYSIASSVEGFKKQAPEYEQEIAATSFYELTFNPATSMEGKSPDARHPNPLLEALMRRIEGKKDSGQSVAAR